jgi:hypothetical protein
MSDTDISKDFPVKLPLGLGTFKSASFASFRISKASSQEFRQMSNFIDGHQ